MSADPATCPHRLTAPHPLPKMLPVLPRNVLTWVPTAEMTNPPALRRCLLCGLVGERARR